MASRPPVGGALTDRRPWLRACGNAVGVSALGCLAPRHLLALGRLLQARAAAGLAPAPARSRRIRPDTLGPLGAQLYTARGEMQRDFEGTLQRVARIGYREVEFAGYFGRTPQQVKTALEGAGLVAPSTHVPIGLLREGWSRALDDAAVMGHRYLVVAWIPAEERRTPEEYRRVADLFNRAGEAAARAGLRFAYHNHDFEFAPLGGRVPYDLLVEAADPRYVAFEMDLYWIARGGGDPLAYFARHPGRFPLVHLKDMDHTPERGMADVGSGTIPWRRILARRAEAGIRHFFVEHDQPPDPFASLRASYTFLSRLDV